MGMTSSTPQPDSQDVLIHSFQLDAENSYCAVSKLCPKKQAMFHVPANVPEHIEHFLPLKDIKKILEDLNEILKNTGFPMNFTNPVLIVSFAVFFLFPTLIPRIGVGIMVLVILPFLLNGVLFFYCRSKRKDGILSYLEDWNRNDRGVKLNIGGYVTNSRSGVTLGSEQGGNYYHFYAATFDRHSLMSRGYLHVVVNRTEREAWCRRNGVQYLAPYTPEQQNMAAVQAAPPPVPQGYAMVPQQQPQAAPTAVQQGFVMMPQQQFQVPPGYVLVPESQAGVAPGAPPPDIDQPPPSYEMSNKMNMA